LTEQNDYAAQLLSPQTFSVSTQATDINLAYLDLCSIHAVFTNSDSAGLQLLRTYIFLRFTFR